MTSRLFLAMLAIVTFSANHFAFGKRNEPRSPEFVAFLKNKTNRHQKPPSGSDTEAFSKRKDFVDKQDRSNTFSVELNEFSDWVIFHSYSFFFHNFRIIMKSDHLNLFTYFQSDKDILTIASGALVNSPTISTINRRKRGAAGGTNVTNGVYWGQAYVGAPVFNFYLTLSTLPVTATLGK